MEIDHNRRDLTETELRDFLEEFRESPYIGVHTQLNALLAQTILDGRNKHDN